MLRADSTAVRFGPALALCGLPSKLLPPDHIKLPDESPTVFFHLLSFGVLESRAGSLASPGAVTGALQVVRSGQRRILLITVSLNIYIYGYFNHFSDFRLPTSDD
jgi:hypothetical protein